MKSIAYALLSLSVIALAPCVLAGDSPQPIAQSVDKPSGAQPGDLVIPSIVDGWELHALDVTKELIFQFPDGRRQPIEVPIYVYLPTRANTPGVVKTLDDVTGAITAMVAKGDLVNPKDLQLLLVALETATSEARRLELTTVPFRGKQ